MKRTIAVILMASAMALPGFVCAQVAPQIAPMMGGDAQAPVASGPQPPITGTVTNKTTGKPAAGDSVVLIQLANGMQESTKTTTDARGHFTLAVPDGGMHLVRITHDKVPYFRPAPPGTKQVEVDVYNGAPQVTGVRGEADVMRIQAQGSTAEVTELWAIENTSNPPATQYSAKAFEIWLPKDAQITGGAALGPNGMPVQAQPVPQSDPGHYAFVFPIRPGETRFQLSYKVPYTGKLEMTPKLSLPFNNVAIMLPKSMTFTGVPAFQPVNDQVDAQVFLAKGVTPGQQLGFTVSGTGVMPQDSAQGEQGQQGGDARQNGAAQQAVPNGRPGGGLGNPEGSPGPIEQYKWWVLGGIALILCGGVWFAMSDRKPAGGAPAASGVAAAVDVSRAPFAAAPATVRQPASGGTLHALKDELFRLETDRLEGKISGERYVELKAALEVVLKHALEREQSPTAVSNV